MARATTAQRQGKVVAVHNMKGGVGKTTVCAHVMRELYRMRKAKVLLLDLDPQFNLSQCVLTRQQYDRLKSKGKTILRVFEAEEPASLFDLSQSDAPLPDVADLVRQLKNTSGSDAKLDIVVGDFDLTRFSLMTSTKTMGVIRSRFRSFIDSCRSNYDLICLDCNPSSSTLTICALENAQHVVSPVRPDRYSVLGVELLSRFIKQFDEISPKPKHWILLNGIPRSKYDMAIENEIRAHAEFGTQTLINKLHSSALLTATSNYTGFASDKKVPHRSRVQKELQSVAQELANQLRLYNGTIVR